MVPLGTHSGWEGSLNIETILMLRDTGHSLSVWHTSMRRRGGVIAPAGCTGDGRQRIILGLKEASINLYLLGFYLTLLHVETRPRQSPC